ncbi:MAG: hypothetical protein ACJAYE_000775 [Candidatus Azotimanducaceae bacterium]|jgi:hypothetical protein
MTTVFEAVQKLCLALPETGETVSHGFPVFTVRHKQFATYSLNHHGDSRVALLLNASIETQSMLTESAPDIFFKPPYIGAKGWIGVELNRGLKWQRVIALTLQAYQRTAPPSLARTSIDPNTPAPTVAMQPEDIDPLKSKANQAILQRLRTICLPLPEVVEDQQFGNPAFRAGKKAFCSLAHNQHGCHLQIWVGRDAQPGFTDTRFNVPAYSGHNGWLDVNLSQKQDWLEIAALVNASYRNFALKRMLKRLDDG